MDFGGHPEGYLQAGTLQENAQKPAEAFDLGGALRED